MVLCSETRGKGGFYSLIVEAEGSRAAMLSWLFWSAKGQGELRVGFLASWRSSERWWHIKW